jgi:hypothetical protein
MKIGDTYLTPLDFIFRCVLLFIELAFFALVLLGIPGGIYYFTWVVCHELSSLGDTLPQPDQVRETGIYLIFLSILLPVIIWGTVPYCSLNVHFRPRIRRHADTALFLLEIITISLCIRVISIVLTLGPHLQSAGHWHAAGQCEGLAIFLGFVILLKLVANVILLSLLLFDRPKIIRQMINEGRQQSRRLLVYAGMEVTITVDDDKLVAVLV